MPSPTDGYITAQIWDELIRLKIVPPGLPPNLMEALADWATMDDEIVAARIWAYQQSLIPQEIKTGVGEYYLDTAVRELGKLTPEERAALSMRLAAKFLPKKNGA